MRIIYMMLICLVSGMVHADGARVPMRYISKGHATIAIIGAGNVGATIAYALMLKNIGAEIIMVDIDQDRCYGEVLDLSDAIPFCYTAKVRQGQLVDAAQADIIIITAGARRKPGQSRLDLIKINKHIVSSIVTGMCPINPHAVIIVVSNPVDLMTYIAQEHADLPKTQVFGSGTWLDTQRLCGIIAHKIGLSEKSIQAYIIGEHGDSQCAAWSSARIAGIPIIMFDQLSLEELEAIAEETKGRGAEIIKNKDATYYGIGACVANICESIVFNQKRIIPVSSYMPDLNVCFSMPVVVGERGVEQVLPLPLSDAEHAQVIQSAEIMRRMLAECEG